MPSTDPRIPSTIYVDGREVLYDGNNGNKYYNLKMQQGERTRFCVYVKRLLVKKGMTIQDLADECNLPVKSVYNMLSIKNTQYRGKVAATIANYLRISRCDWGYLKLTEEDLKPNKNIVQIANTKKYKRKKAAKEKAKALEEKRRNASFDSCML